MSSESDTCESSNMISDVQGAKRMRGTHESTNDKNVRSSERETDWHLASREYEPQEENEHRGGDAEERDRDDSVVLFRRRMETSRYSRDVDGAGIPCNCGDDGGEESESFVLVDVRFED